MDFRQAKTPAGTKPSMLASQMPNVDAEEALMEEIAAATPKERMPAGKKEQLPGPYPLPMPGVTVTQEAAPVQDQFADLPTEDQFADLPSIDETIPEPTEDVNNFNLMLGGREVRMNNGVAQIYDNEEKSWRNPTGTEKFIAAMTLDTIANAPALAGQMIGAYAGAQLPFPGLTALGGIAGGMGGATLNEDVLNAMRKDPQANKYISTLEAISGETASPLGAVETGALSVIGEGLGAILSRAFGRGEKLVRSADEQAAAAFEEALPKVAETAEAAKRLGIDVKAADVASTLPGGGAVAEKQAMQAAGLFGEGAKIAYERQVNAQRDALVTVLKDVKKMVGGAEATTPLESIKKTAKEGFEKNINIVDRYISRWKTTLGQLRQGVSEAAKAKRYDPTQLMSGVQAQLRELPGFESFITPDGTINSTALRSYAKNFLGSDQDAKLFVEQVALLQNIVNKDIAFAKAMGPKLKVFETPASTKIVTKTITPEPGMGSMVPEFEPFEVVDGFRFNPKKTEVGAGTGIKSYDNLPPTMSGEAIGGFTFDEISRIVDRFQELAVKTDNPRMKQLAGMALDYENTIMKKAYKDAGNESMAKTVEAAKETFYNEIDGLQAVRNKIAVGIQKGTLGDAILTMTPEDVKMFKSFLSPKELAEARMKAFNSAVLNESILNPNKTINASYIESKFLKDEKTREAMMELFGKDGFDNIKSVVNIAKVLENKNLSPQAYTRVTKDLAGQLVKAEKQLGWFQHGKAIFGFLSSGNEKAAKMLAENIANYEKAMKPVPRTKTLKALEFGAEVSEEAIKGSPVGKALLLENLIEYSGEE